MTRKNIAYPSFFSLMACYAVVAWALSGTGEARYEALHIALDSSNAMLSGLFAIFLLITSKNIGGRSLRAYLSLAFGYCALTELLHALVGIEWVGSYEWIQQASHKLRPATWPPSTYMLPIGMAVAIWAERRKLSLGKLAAILSVTLLLLYAIFFNLPSYRSIDLLGINRPYQAPVLLLLVAVATSFWSRRGSDPLYGGLACSLVFLIASDMFMMYSTSPHEKWTMIAHSGKFFGYLVAHAVMLDLTLDDIVARNSAEAELRLNLIRLTELNAKLVEAQAQLLQSEKMASIGQLAAGVAHEINNPIAFVKSNLGSLKQQAEDLLSVIDAYCAADPLLAACPEIQDAIQTTKKNVDLDFLRQDVLSLISESLAGVIRVKEIVQNLKDFARIDAVDWQFANLECGLDSTLNIVWNEIKSKIDVKREYAGLPEIECIAGQLNQVFMNLLLNAAHAIEARGTITVRTGFDDTNVWIEIADTGTGIPEENISHIFEPFFTTQPVGKGTGLGLSLAWSIVKRHHGSISVDTHLGVGTTFRVILPRQRLQENVLSWPQTDGVAASRIAA